jgi:hypothetical protein
LKTNVEEWLQIIGLEKYKGQFIKEQIKTPKDMEVLKSFGRNEIEKELKITKTGNVFNFLFSFISLCLFDNARLVNRKLFVSNPYNTPLRIIIMFL